VSRALVIAWAAALSAPALAVQLHAQARWEVSVGASGAQEIVRSRPDTTRERRSGLVFTGEAVATRGRRLVARVRYGQGRVTADTGTPPSPRRNVVEGEALFGYKVRPWLTLWVGPHARTFVVTGLSDRRWLFWSGRATARGGLFPGVESFLELWQGFTGTLSRPAGSASGGGAEAGLELRLARRPLWARLGYRIEQGRANGGPRETVEAFTLTVGYVPLR